MAKHVGGADATGYMVMGNMIEAAANAMVKSPEPTLETLTAAAEAGLGSIAVPFALVANNPNRKLERLYELRNSTVVDKAYTAYEIGVDETKKYCIGIDKAGRPAPVFWQETMLAATVGASDARCSAVGSRMFGMIWDRQVQTAARMPELFKATLQTR